MSKILSFFSLFILAQGIRHNIRAEIGELYKTMDALKQVNSDIHQNESKLAQTGQESVNKLLKAENRSRDKALATLRKNDIGFDVVEQEMERKMH